MKIDKFTLLIVKDDLLESIILRNLFYTEKIQIQKISKILVLSALSDFIYVKKVKDIQEFKLLFDLYRTKKIRTKSKILFILNDEKVQEDDIKQKDIKVVSLCKINKEVFRICYDTVINEMGFNTSFDTIYDMYKSQLKDLEIKDILRTLPFAFLNGSLELTEQESFLQKYFEVYKKIFIYVKVKEYKARLELVNGLMMLEDPYIFLNNFILKVSRLYIENIDSYLYSKFKEAGKFEKLDLLKLHVAISKSKSFRYNKSTFVENFVNFLI